MLLQVMFELESFATMTAFELSQVWPVCVVGHVSLEFVESWKLFAAQTAGLKIIISILGSRIFHSIQVSTSFCNFHIFLDLELYVLFD